MPVLKRLLLVDDDESNLDLLHRRLLRGGYLADKTVSGEQALAMLADHSYDLVVLDQMLPGISGLETLRRIRETWHASELPVIMATALDDSESIATALRMGANDYVTKPMDFTIMLARIETRLQLSASAQEMRRTKELYQLALRASEEGLWDWDLATGRLDYSERWKAMLGFTEAEISNSPDEWFGRIHVRDRDRVRGEIQAHIEGRTPGLASEYRMRHKDGEYRWMEVRGGVSRDAAGRAVRLGGYQTDTTVRKTIDTVTSLHNRKWIEHELESVDAEGRRTALLLIELDGFERIEEHMPNGELACLLMAVATRFRDALGRAPGESSAELTRSSDHQFAILLRDPHGPAAAKELAAHLLAAVAQPFRIGKETVFATACAGIAMTYGTESGDDLFRDANAALRNAREKGTGQSEIFQTFMRRDDLAEMRFEHDLRHAIEQSEFEVYYQPKVDLERGEIVDCEALVRWNRPGHGLVLPGDFIPAAERNGLIGPLGRFVLRRACRDIVELRRSCPGLKVSVNVSGRQFAEPDLVEQVRLAIAEAELDPSVLRLEITETFLVEDPDTAFATLGRLRAMGVGLKLDDFGSGYSSLDYLQRFPFDSLKIDRTFVSRLTSSHESAEIVRAIVGLAASLHMNMVAEGIENRAQLECLKQLGCQYGQGYWFSPPVELQRMKELLEEWKIQKHRGPAEDKPAACLEGDE